MKVPPLFGLFALALGACAPAPAASGPAPAPGGAAPTPPSASAPPAQQPAEPVGQETVPSPGEAPGNWWQLDAAANRFPGTSTERAYAELLGGKQPQRTVVVAVLDSGIDIQHEDLDGVLWVNEDEVAGNGRDDDNNGYVDDRHGWNFIGGRDGRNVNQDTYEVTRLYVRCQAGAGNVPASLRSRCPEIVRDFEGRRAEATQQLQQARQIATAVEQMQRTLRAEVGTDSLTVARVRAIRSLRPDVSRAQQIFLSIHEQGLTPEQLLEQVEGVRTQVEYNLNPSFDPRPIVGDNYANGNERGYGNPDVEGPDPAHGTHVAGIIAAERNNGRGINGIAPAVRIMSVRTVPDGDERDKDVANAIRYAVDNGAHIINMSFGKSWSPEKELVDEAVRYADSKGVLLVHAAGNDGSDTEREPSYPIRTYAAGGAPQRWLEIGASSWQGPDHLAADFSNYGRLVDVFAPGVDILSTTPDNQYESFDGTSMASPVTAGVAALIMAYYPGLSATEVRDIILQSATRYADQRVVRPGSESDRVPFGSLSVTGAVVNAHAALQLAEQRSRR